MQKIITADGVEYLTEKANYIKQHSNGCLVLCDEAEAEGVAYNGTPYMFEDGTVVKEVDGGSELASINTALNVMLGVE